MLELRDIVKAYRTSTFTQTALDGVSVAFRDNEFVAVLGQSGSGKTTMLNVVGGLDHVDDGDLVIDGVSTKDFRDRDWDAYRNNRIGFVFQSYNLIPHQSVLANVELALTLSGVSRAERRQRALSALEQVGLADHVGKRPSQLSGGQMQRVAIARALINDPEILLADEPTGALDSATSVQVMDLLREVARDRLVIMVTHNPELAHEYATRIVELADGSIVSDTDPFEPDAALERRAKAARRTRMGALTALALSFNNLMTKKGRTIMTSFAGSIGIIGIALILALANGVNGYIARTEEETLSSYPLQIERLGMDYTAILSQAADSSSASDLPSGAIGERRTLKDMFGSATTNDLAHLKTYLDHDGGGIDALTNAVEYRYDVTPQLYLPRDAGTTGLGGAPTQVNPDSAFSSFGALSRQSQMSTFKQLASDTSLYQDQYRLRSGRWPSGANELVVVLTPDGRVTDATEYALGLRDHAELEAMMQTYASGQASGSPLASSASTPSPTGSPTTTASAAPSATASAGATPAATSTAAPAERTLHGNDLIGRTLKLVPAYERYQHDDARGVWVDKSDDASFMGSLVDSGEDVRVVGVIQAKDKQGSLNPGVYYTPALTSHLMKVADGADIVKDQLAHPDKDVFSGTSFADLAAGKGADSVDLSSLFTIDSSKLKSAFSIDPSKIDASALDLSGLDLSGITSEPLDLSRLDLSALQDANPQIDLSGIDLSSTSLSGLATQYPELADVDYPTLISTALADGVIKDGASGRVSQMMTQVIAGFADYQAEHAAGADASDPADDPDLATLTADYLAQPSVQRTISDTLGSGEVIDSARLTENLTKALGDDAAVADVSASVRDQLVTAIGQQVAEQVGSQITQALAASVQAAMSQAMTQMMTAVQQQIQTQVQAAMTRVTEQIPAAMTVDQSAFKDAFTLDMTPTELAELMSTLVTTDTPTYDTNLSDLGWADPANPSGVDIYPKDFESKDEVKTLLADYSSDQTAEGHKDRAITYTDVVSTLMSSVTRIVNIISWMLIAFVAISLVVSSIMIAIITYISVLERKKEIGILRAIGASKPDVRHVFNAETVIEGLLAGLLGVGITLLLCLPVNAIVNDRFGVYPIAQLPWTAGVVLILISVALTVLAGLIPSGKAAREDPVEALRSE
ncbi:ABC transporter ATP-binding protein/permease [Actinomyces haliotis]|uniref:ABC transporter ATP-binding protein/permease n=1 Tax=Actinomyces haliotis TaxID=1280843 RepID=UPI00188F86E1|nr:ABC transporter ATP-binding protein/permease [Actinomyces haliotis]